MNELHQEHWKPFRKFCLGNSTARCRPWPQKRLLIVSRNSTSAEAPDGVAQFDRDKRRDDAPNTSGLHASHLTPKFDQEALPNTLIYVRHLPVCGSVRRTAVEYPTGACNLAPPAGARWTRGQRFALRHQKPNSRGQRRARRRCPHSPRSS